MVVVNTKGGQRLHFTLQTYTRSACILTLHPVILPISYLIFSHLFELSECILSFLFFIFYIASPALLWVRVCLCKCGRRDVCLPGAALDKTGVFHDALVVCVHPLKH